MNEISKLRHEPQNPGRPGHPYPGHPAAERRLPTMAEGPLPPPWQVEILAKLYGQERVRGMSFIDSYSPEAMALAPPAWSPSAVLTTHAATAPAYAARRQLRHAGR